MNPRFGWSFLTIVCVAAVAFYLWPRTSVSQQPQYLSITTEQVVSKTIDSESVLTLKFGTDVQSFKWALTFQGERLAAGSILANHRLESKKFVYDSNSSTPTSKCPEGGFFIQDATYRSPNGEIFGVDRYMIWFGFRGNPVRSNRWIPFFGPTSRAGAQSKHGTQDATVLWINFMNPKKQLAPAEPPLVYRPYADYYKPWKP